MAEWGTYRMWRQSVNAISNMGSSAAWLGDWRPTDITFRARSLEEAQRKADRFWREAQLGAGSMVCIPVDEQLDIERYGVKR